VSGSWKMDYKHQTFGNQWRSDSKRRMHTHPRRWKLGRITDPRTGKDKIIRVTVRTAYGTEMRRSTVKLCRLPIQKEDMAVEKEWFSTGGECWLKYTNRFIVNKEDHIKISINYIRYLDASQRRYYGNHNNQCTIINNQGILYYNIIMSHVSISLHHTHTYKLTQIMIILLYYTKTIV